MRPVVKYILWIHAITIAVLSVVSCVKDKTVIEPVVPDEAERVRLEIYTVTDDYDMPASRASESVFDNEPMVLSFWQDGDDFVFYEATKAEYDGTLSTVMLVPTENPAVLVIITNVPSAQFYNGTAEVTLNENNLKEALRGKTLTEVEQHGILQTVSLGTDILTSLPFSNSTATLPMSAVCQVSAIQAGQTLGTDNSKIPLRRAVAKVSVLVDGGISQYFSLSGVGIAGAPARGSFYNVSGTYNTASQVITYGDGTNGMALPTTLSGGDVSTEYDPIYLYEAPAGQQTALIVKASVNGTTYYYRVPFYDDDFIDIKRNTNYIFNIKSAGTGYKTMQEAIDSDGLPGFEYEIKVVDTGSYDIVSNEDFYIGVSNSAIELLLEDGASITSTVSILTNASLAATGSTIITNDSNIVLSHTAVSASGMTLAITIPPTVSTATVTIRVGSLAKEIAINRRQPMSSAGLDMMPYNDYVSCTIYNRGSGSWLSVSRDGVTSSSVGITYGEPGMLYLMASGGIASYRTGGEIHAVRAATGRSKIYVSQYFKAVR